MSDTGYQIITACATVIMAFANVTILILGFFFKDKLDSLKTLVDKVAGIDKRVVRLETINGVEER